MNARIFSPVSSEGTGTLTCGRLKMEIKWLQTSTHTHTHTHTHKTHLLKRTRDYSVLPPRSSPEAARVGCDCAIEPKPAEHEKQQDVHWRSWMQERRRWRLPITTPISHKYSYIYEPVLYCIWNGAETDAECQHVNIQTCNTFIRQHVHVDVHYFNTLILLERVNPEAYHLCCPCK